MDGTGDLFCPLIEALGSDVATIVVRYPDGPLSYCEHEAIARAALPTDRPFVVLGESYSGPVAVSLAAESPPGLLGYILSTSFVGCPRPILKLLRPLLSLGSLNLLPGWIAAHFTLGRFGTSDLREAQQRVLRSVSARTLVARLRSMADVDVCEELKNISVPGLYLRATEDRLVPHQAARLFERLASKGRVVDVEGPHFLLQANPQGAAREIRTFMADATLAACRVTGSPL
jgi:pimeloyl-[acyl-carrier protein] methyl ester esterase